MDRMREWYHLKPFFSTVEASSASSYVPFEAHGFESTRTSLEIMYGMGEKSDHKVANTVI